MRLAGSASWMVCEDEGRELAKALHVRDAAGLDTSANPDAPPLLDPPVPVNEQWRRRFAGIAPAWNAWWARLVRELAAAPTQSMAFTEAVAGASGDIRGLLDAALPDAELWAGERDRQRARVVPHRGDALAVNEIVRAVEQQLGRRAAPFRLDLLTLPVRGLWRREAAVGAEVGDRPGLQPSPALLLSQHLRADRAELERVVRPVIAALA